MAVLAVYLESSGAVVRLLVFTRRAHLGIGHEQMADRFTEVLHSPSAELDLLMFGFVH